MRRPVSVVKSCLICKKDNPSARNKYCTNECAAIAYSKREKARQQRRNKKCQGCGGDKELGVRGSRFCAECRRLHQDATKSMEAERGRRRWLKEIAEREERGEVFHSRTADAPPGKKWCSRCQNFRPNSSFHKRSNGGLASYCRPCQKSYLQARHYKIKFGISWEEYEALSKAQEDRCAICGGKPRKHALAVDHDHHTGEIRGLLCSKCNHRLLGSAAESPERLRRAADYLEGHEASKLWGYTRFVPGFEEGIE